MLKTFVAAAFATLLLGTQSRAATISLSSPSAVNAGDSLTVEVAVSLSPGEGLFAFQMGVLFPSFLQAQSVTEVGYFAGDGCCFFAGTIDNTGLSITDIFDSLSGSDLMVSSGALFDVAFTALAPGTGSVSIDPDTVLLLDGDLNELSVDVSPGTVTVNGGADAPEPSTAMLLGAAGLLACGIRRKNRSGDQCK